MLVSYRLKVKEFLSRGCTSLVCHSLPSARPQRTSPSSSTLSCGALPQLLSDHLVISTNSQEHKLFLGP